MNRTALTAILAMISLAACGGGSTVTRSASAMKVGEVYAPIFADGENSLADMNQEGASYFVGKADGTVSQMSIRFNEDRTIAYVSADGGEEVAYANRANYYDYGYYFYGTWTNEEGEQLYYDTNTGSMGRPTFSDGNYTTGAGWGGLETLPDNLPSGQAVYSGTFYTNGDIQIGGSFSMSTDFADNRITGAFTGGYFHYGNGETFGTIDGTIEDSRVAGSFYVDGRYEGELGFQGAFYGENGSEIGGGLAGTLTDSLGNEHTTGGSFNGYRNWTEGDEEEYPFPMSSY